MKVSGNSIINKIGSISTAYRHRDIENFGFMLGTVSLALIIMASSMIFVSTKKEKKILSSSAMYTETFTTSLSEVDGSVVGVYTNDTYTKAFVMFKFDNVKDVPLDAKDYQMFLSAYNDHMNVQPSGSIYVFGSTGYFGLYFADVRGFDKQVLDITVRCNNIIGEIPELTVPSDMGASFDEFDQFRIYANFGASGTIKLDSLNEKELIVSDLYAEIVGENDELALRTELNEQLKAMASDLDKATEYSRRLTDAGIVVPETPSFIGTDSIKLNEDNKLYYLTTDMVLAGGYSFNWQDGSIKDGYLDALLNDKEPDVFFSEKKQEYNDSTYNIGLSDLSWVKLNGDPFIYGGTLAMPGDEDIQDNIGLLTSVWSDYYNLKQEYQVVTLNKLLMLELMSKSQESSISVNNDENSLCLWQQI